jgi:hypothetical protein
VLLTVCRGRDPSIPVDSLEGPPFPLTAAELTALMEASELAPVRPLDEFMDDNNPPVHRLRGAFRRI